MCVQPYFNYLFPCIYFIFADFGDGLTYNTRAEEPVDVSETSEADLDVAFTKTPSDTSDSGSQDRPAESAAAKKARDAAVAKDKSAPQATSPSSGLKAVGPKKAAAAATRKATADRLKSQLQAARSSAAPLTVASGGTPPLVSDFLRPEDDAARKQVQESESQKVTHFTTIFGPDIYQLFHLTFISYFI